MNKHAVSRFSSLQIKQFSLRNRVVVPPMASSTATTSGFVTQQTLEHYARLTEADAGLVIVEYTFVHALGRSEENQLGISSDAHVDGLVKIAQIIKRSSAIAGIQLSHGGGKSSHELTGGRLLGPSAIPVPVKGDDLETPEPMTQQDIEVMQHAFIASARRAVEAGFDLVEFHSAHGYGLNQWLSPLTNQRTDAFGNDLTGRMRALSEIIQKVRENHPEILLSVRMPGQDFLDGGLTTADTARFARQLEALGVNILHVSSGIGGWRRPSTRIGEGYLVSEASEIQSQVSIPVIGVGGIESGKYIDNGLRERKFSLAAVGRAILKDPRAWAENQMCETGNPSSPLQSEAAQIKIG